MKFEELKKLAWETYPPHSLEFDDLNEFWTYEDAYGCVGFLEIEETAEGMIKASFFWGDDLITEREFDYSGFRYALERHMWSENAHMREKN